MPEPWIKVKVGITRSDKVLGLPSDVARWGWMKVLTEAKVQRQMGVFGSRAHLVDLIGRHGKFFDDYVKAGLLHVAPVRCEECKTRSHDVRAGQVVVHDFRKEQRDPSNADRQASWYAERATEPNDGPNDQSNDPPNDGSNDLPNGSSNAGPNGSLTRAGGDGDGDGDRRTLKRSPTAGNRADEQPATEAELAAMLR